MKEVCQKHQLAFHLDGARVFNALVETRKNYKEYAKHFDTISICLSKGLGAPVGSALIGSAEDIHRAQRLRKLMGGGMRQAGHLAAAGIYALHHHVERLKDDHRRAKDIEKILEPLAYVEEILPVDTNIIIFQVHKNYPVDHLIQNLKDLGVLAIKFGPYSVRMVTHVGITDSMIERLGEILD